MFRPKCFFATAMTRRGTHPISVPLGRLLLASVIRVSSVSRKTGVEACLKQAKNLLAGGSDRPQD